MRKSTFFMVVSALQALLLLFLLASADGRRRASAAALDRQRTMAARFELTDLCLFTEARYTRHLSQADFASAFQEHPSSLEHFPSGSLAPPPVSEAR